MIDFNSDDRLYYKRIGGFHMQALKGEAIPLKARCLVLNLPASPFSG
jgi:hypothetical protein